MRRILRALELFLRHVIVYPVLKILFRNPPARETIDLKQVRNLLILRYDRLGDIIVTTPIFRALRKANRNLRVGVFCSPSNAELVRFDPNADRIHVLRSNWWRLAQEILAARKARYDVVLNFIFNRTTSGGILANLIAPRGIKVGQGAEKYSFYFNKMLRLPRGDRHMVEILVFFLRETFGLRLKSSDLKMEIIVDPNAAARVSEFLRSNSFAGGSPRSRRFQSYCVLNLSATDQVRKITQPQGSVMAHVLTTDLGWNTVVISSPAESEWRNRTVRETASPRCIAYPSQQGNLREIAELIRGARFVVTPDTAIVHFASACGTPVMGFFTHLQAAVEWLPYKVRNKIVFAPEGQPVSSLTEEVIRRELKAFAKMFRGSRANQK